MCFLGVWACQWRELKPISFGGKGKAAVKGNSTGDEEAGFVRDDRGAGSDGAGAYEMVGMASRDGVP